MRARCVALEAELGDLQREVELRAEQEGALKEVRLASLTAGHGQAELLNMEAWSMYMLLAVPEVVQVGPRVHCDRLSPRMCGMSSKAEDKNGGVLASQGTYQGIALTFDMYRWFQRRWSSPAWYFASTSLKAHFVKACSLWGGILPSSAGDVLLDLPFLHAWKYWGPWPPSLCLKRACHCAGLAGGGTRPRPSAANSQ